MTVPIPLKAVLFDLDGTLLDTAPDMALALNLQRIRHGLTKLEYEPIRMTVSHGARALVTLAFEITEGDPDFEILRQEFLTIYGETPVQGAVTFDGIQNLLGYLEQKGISWGVVTNKPRKFTTTILDALQLTHRCKTIVCPDDVTNTKPDPEPLLLACKQIGCTPEQAIYIGDHIRDIEAGRNAGMPTIAVAYGYLQPDDNIHEWHADFNVNHADEILPLLMPRISND